MSSKAKSLSARASANPQDIRSFKTSHYRPDIDGIRAYAVMFVVLFHLNADWLSGGFIGVDVFFVISGYLITKIIVNEVGTTGRFNYANFYARRVRRLFPAMIVTVVVTSIAAIILFPQSALKIYVPEAIFSTTSLSNFYFWGQAGYFDSDAITKPLLHTWSLAVEEQFYLIWPLFTALFLARDRTKKTLTILFCVSFVSFWSNIVMVRMGELNTMFFMMPARVFEFGIGASIVWFERYRPEKNIWLEQARLIPPLKEYLNG